MTLLALGTVEVLTACGESSAEEAVANTSSAPTKGPTATAAPSTANLPLQSALPATKRPAPTGQIDRLPGRGRFLSLTVDDGASSEVVGAYADFARETGARFTFFVTGQYDSWRDNRKALLPLVESGQIQLSNHSWSHPDLTTLSAKSVADELGRTGKFLRNQFGVEAAPYFRPPFGNHNAAVDAVAADAGYTVPVLWYGSLSDSGEITEKYLLQVARQYLRAQRIVIGHANHAPVTRVFGELAEIIQRRRLQMVTLDDYFARPA